MKFTVAAAIAVATISAVDVTTAFAPSSFGTTTATSNIHNINTQLFAATLEKTETPVRTPESPDRVQEVRERFRAASVDAANAKGCSQADTGDEWWRSPLPPSPRKVTAGDPLRVIIAGGGVAGLVAAAACHAKGMKVQIFEQASQYAPYGGPIQIQSNALRALQRINPVIFDELVKAGTVTADRVSGLKIGYDKGVFLNLGKQYKKGDWLVRFDTLQPALDAGLSATVVVDRPVIQQILLNEGVPPDTVRIKSRIANYEELGEGKGIKVRATQ
jgi:zeaxanthin epoxidase